MSTTFTYELGTTVVVSVVDTADGEITPITDMCADGLSKLIAEYADSPRVQALICAMLKPTQELEDTTNDCLAKVLDIDMAEGIQLDLIGAIVGEPRAGQSDVNYARALRVRVRVNRSDGRFEDMYRIVDLWTGSTPTQIEEYFPAAMEITTIEYNAAPFDLFERLHAAKAAGVNLRYTYGFGATATFQFSVTYGSAETSATTGFGSTHTTTGGVLAGVVG